MRSPLVLALLLTPAFLGAQATSRWTLGWTDGSYRYVGNERVPVGPQTATLTVVTTTGDSVVATLPTANPTIVDTLDGTLTATRMVLNARRRFAIARRAGDGAVGTSDVSWVMRFEFDITGDTGSGTRIRKVSLPGARSSDPDIVRVSLRRED